MQAIRDTKGRFIKNFIKPVEWIEKNRKTMLGENNHFYGKTHTEEVKQIIREKRALQDMTWRKGFKHTEETKEKISENRIGKATGKNCSFWKGGITPINVAIRSSTIYSKWRKSVFERDDYTCVHCKVRGGNLNVHHIKSFSEYPKLRFDIDNGITLCVPCHLKTFTFMGNQYKKICT